MSGEAPAAFDSPRGGSFRRASFIALVAFVAGIAAMALVLRFWVGFPTAQAPETVTMPTETVRGAQAALPPGTDLASLHAREQALAGRIDQLEARLAGIDTDARAASAYATRAEGLMIAFAARRALDRGLPLGYVEAQLNQRFRAMAPAAVGTITQAAHEPVTLEDLRLALDTIAPNLTAGSPGDSIGTRLRRQLNALIVIRQESSPSPRPSDRLARARRLLAAGQVEAAMAEVARLPGAARATSWIGAANRYIEARRALNTLELAAIQGRTDMPASPTGI